MKQLFVTLILAVLTSHALAEPNRGHDHDGPGGGRQCNRMENFFDYGLRQCWKTRQTGCIQYLVSVIPANDLNECKQDLYPNCLATCYSVWGVNDSGCSSGCSQYFRP